MTREELREAIRGLEPGETLEVGAPGGFSDFVTVFRRYPPSSPAAGDAFRSGWRFPYVVQVNGKAFGQLCYTAAGAIGALVPVVAGATMYGVEAAGNEVTP